MKAGVSILLMLLMGTGPWLCCCSAGQLTPPAKPVSAPKPSCCHAQHSPTEKTDGPAPSRPCSCQDERQPQTLAIPDNSGTDLASFGFYGAASDAVLAIAPAPVNQTNCAVPPFLNAPDILSLCHILRC
jgi:hypothetical protein